MNILIRADSSSKIGTGHIMRDLVLATRYKNDTVIFACRELEGNINQKIISFGYKIELLETDKLDELDFLVKQLKIDMLIIDNYEIDITFEQQLKIKNPHLQIMIIDDTYEKHHCDILLNHNIYADKKRYKDLVPQECQLRCGSEFTLLRDEFYEEKKRKREKEFKILVAMGGADTKNLNIKILKTLKNLKNVQVNIATTTANKNIEKLKSYCQNKQWIQLHIDSNKIAKLMSESIFGIITPSVTANEMYFMKIPFIAIKTAKNQKYMYSFLKKEHTKNCMVLKKFNNKTLKRSLKKMLYEV
jgi:UDP-2,4-diacetamido-2,4,6-trideoxy-beta-L-altropyranose hydrolase